jgi:tetratricopeptide (TPR) repeat protein
MRSPDTVNSPTPRALHHRDISRLVALLNADRPAEAEAATRDALREFPDAGMLWKVLSVALLRQNRDALAALRKAAELLPDDPEAQDNLASALLDHGLWSEALAGFARVLQARPNDVEALVGSGDALQKLGRAEASIQYYRHALRVAPKHPGAHNNLGNAFLALGRHADAAGYYRLALDIRPRDPVILCNLASAQSRLKFKDEALASIRAALALDPDLVVGHNTLGMILASFGDREGAIASFRQALILDSHDVDTLNNLANTLREIGHRRDALTLFARAVKCNPMRADSHCNLGMTLFELRQIHDAIEAFRQALALDPSYAPAHLNLALALRQQRLPAEAEASCQAALAAKPDYVDALAFLGELKADRGRFTEAQQLVQQALAIDPNFAPAVASVATHRKMTAADSEWARHADGLLQKTLPLQHEIGLRYALGKYFDDIGDYSKAFGQFSRANELGKLLSGPYEAAKLAGHVDRIISMFDAEFLGRPWRTDGMPAPIFIVGMPRSGTSLAEQILASHPAVFGAGEVSFWDAAYRRVRAAHDAGHDANLIARLTGEYRAKFARHSAETPRIVDKLPANFFYLGLIHACFPNARFIHMQRHPADTCLSIYFQHFFNIGPYANDLGSLADYYRQYLRIMDHWRARLPPAALLDVPYEQLVGDQQSWTRRMLEFLGLPWDPRCLEFDSTERVVITASKWQVRQKIHSSSAGRHKNYEQFLGPLKDLIA